MNVGGIGMKKLLKGSLLGVLVVTLAFGTPLLASANPSKGVGQGQAQQAQGQQKQQGQVQGPQAQQKQQGQGLAQQVKKEQQERKETLKAERQQVKDELKIAKKESQAALKEAQKQAKVVFKAQAIELEAEGDFEGAFEAQTDAVHIDLRDKSSYTKLGHLYRQLHGNKGVNVFVNGKHPVFDVPPVIKSGRTLIPIRAISESLKAEVQWDETERKVTITRDNAVIVLFIDKAVAYVNGQEVPLDVPAMIENSRTFVPIRFISEAFKAEVDYDEESGSAIIVDEEVIDEEDESIEGTDTNNEDEEEDSDLASDESDSSDESATDQDEDNQTDDN